MAVLRWFGPLSAVVVRWMIQRRFSVMSESSNAHSIDKELLAQYLQQLWSQLPVCSEKALNVLLKGRAQIAGVCLSERLVPGVKLHESCGRWGLSFVYGDHRDWMGPHHGKLLQE